MEFLESQDIKNGVDAFVDDHQNLVFVLYGQGYRAEGKEGILTTQVTVKAYDEDKKPINFANLLDSLIVSEYQMEPNLWEVSTTSKQCFELTSSVLSTTSKQCFELTAASFLVCSLIFIEY
ncbi:Tn5253 hypothetical protein [Streptococcus pneumoniae]|nr:Tn5253 hypothetical protein [Streptococcus pneumoniae]